MFKRVAIMLLCLMMVFIATFGFVVGVVAVPTIYSYAEVIDDDAIYVPLRDPSDLVTSFQSYCKSRDLTIEGSIGDAVTTFTTGAFNSACNTIGINIPQLQAEIKAEYDQFGKPIKFMYSATGIDAMNRIFAQFLQDNELSVGDSADQQDNTVYSGYSIGNNLVWLKSTSGNANGTPLAKGSYLTPPTPEQVLNRSSFDTSLGFNIGTDVYTYRWSYRLQTSGDWHILNLYKNGSQIASGELQVRAFYSSSLPTKYCGLVLMMSTDNKVYFGTYVVDAPYDKNQLITYGPALSVSNNISSAVVFLTTFNTVINNNTYEGDTYITNEGDVIVEPDPVPPGGNDPGWDIGGGGGTATDGDGNTWNIQFPDFELPDLNIDWSINGLGEKFPFSIPFDLVALVTVLNAEPEAPRFEGTVNFGFTTWDYDINLQQFDSVAQACRIAELLLLVVGLILITRSIIKG